MNHLIVDGFNLAFRSHFAFGTLTTSAGVPSGCVYGFMVSLRSIKSKYPEFHITVAWDTEAKRKKEVYSDYKANRPRFDIATHISDLKSILSSMNVSQCEYLGEEADDVIATVAKRYSEDGLVYIYSSDKDLMQLVKDGKVILIRPKVGAGEERIYDEGAVRNEFGVGPDRLACFLAFRGDPVDNVPGVERVPSKLLSRLIEKYNDPRTVYGSMANEPLTEFQRASMGKSEQQVYVNFELVRLRDDLDVAISNGTPNPDEVGKYLDKYEIRSIKADKYVGQFDRESSFLNRKSPSIKNYSLFEEGG